MAEQALTKAQCAKAANQQAFESAARHLLTRKEPSSQLNGASPELLRDLQDIHDDNTPDAWRDLLIYTCIAYGLDWPDDL